MITWFFQKKYLHLSIKKLKMTTKQKYFYIFTEESLLLSGTPYNKIKLLTLLTKLNKLSIRLSMFNIKNKISGTEESYAGTAESLQYSNAMKMTSEMSKECRNLISETLNSNMSFDNEEAVDQLVVHVRFADLYALESYWKQFKYESYK